MAKPAEPSVEYTQSEIWDPQSDVLKGLYDQSTDWYLQNNPAIQDAARQSQVYGQNALDSAAGAWQQNLQGGNLAGMNLAGQLQGMMGGGGISGTTIGSQDIGSRDIYSNDFNAQSIDPNAMDDRNAVSTNIGSRDVNGNSVGMVDRSKARNTFDSRVGPGGSLANMMDMYRGQATTAGQDMLSNVDARAAAAGIGGGSAHGNAMGRGFEGINSNLQSQMAQTGYDAYNRDLDRNLGISRDTDLMNQERTLSNQGNTLAANQGNQQAALAASQGNQNAALQASLANQGSYQDILMANQAANLQAGQGNQQANLAAQQANQAAALQAGQGNQQAALQAALGNQQTALGAGQSNQQYQLGQQQNMANLIGQQQQSSYDAIGQQADMQNFINGPMQGIMNSAGGMQMLQSLIGSPQLLNQSMANGSAPGAGPSYNVGTSGVGISG